jgi:predicted permease
MLLFRDLRYAIRQLRNAPLFAITAIVTLALGIGANAAMFSVIDQVLLHRLPFPAAERVMQVAVRSASGGFAPTSLPDVQDWQARSHSFQQIGYYAMQFPTLGGVATPKLVPQVVSSANLFDMLQVKPMLGRSFLPSDALAGTSNVVILSEHTWREMYHGDRQIIGRTVPVGGVAHTVVGVMPSGFDFPVFGIKDCIWTPFPTGMKGLQDRGNDPLTVMGRLRPGVSLADATREMNSIHDQLRREYPKDEDSSPIILKSYPDVVTGDVRPAILALDGAVLAVWLIACANVAGLLLARGNGRRREVALRTALGAGRGRLMQQFFTENLLLSLAGGALGLLLASFALRLLSHYLENAIVFGDQVHIDAKVCAYLLIASCVSAILFGLLPALHASSAPAQEGLRQGTAGGGTTRKQSFWRDGLVVGEIALTLALLVAAGLMVRTLMSLRNAHLGFAADQVTVGQIYLPNHSAFYIGSTAVPTGPNIMQTFYTPLLARLAAQPGVQSVGLTTVRPLEGNWDFNTSIDISGRPKPQRSDHSGAQARFTSADYFKTMGIRLMAGRFFSTLDAPADQPAVIVNQAFVRRFFSADAAHGGSQNPLGQQVRYNDDGPRQWATIVGVVDDSPQKSVGQPALPEVNFNLAQILPSDDLYTVLGTFFMNVTVRSTLPSATVADAMRRAIHDLQPDAALDNVATMNDVVDDSLGDQMLAARLLGLFALIGLGIAVAGVYGLLAYTVSQRTRELGVRLALGAQRESVLWLILKRAMVLLGVGMLIGAFVSAATGKLLVSLLPYKFNGDDGMVLLSVAALLGVCGLAASYLPARRAARIDPVVALRAD